MPLTSPHEPITITAEWKGKSRLHYYADFVMQTDAVVGRVLGALGKSGVADNTLVLFTSDNGKSIYCGAAELEKLGHYPSGPLRGYKTMVYEGGHREPFIVRWPGTVKPGTVCGKLVHQADILATLADILGSKLPDNAGEDSFSFVSLLKGGDQPVREHAVSCAMNGTPGLRRGDWKYIAATQPELYNLAADIGETKNLAGEQHGRVAEMKALLEKLIADGRSTPGPVQTNDVPINLWKTGKRSAAKSK